MCIKFDKERKRLASKFLQLRQERFSSQSGPSHNIVFKLIEVNTFWLQSEELQTKSLFHIEKIHLCYLLGAATVPT
jgi:hypothetical protein